MTYANPASLLRDARRRHAVSQAALARRAATTQRHISRIERGEVSPTVDTLERLLACLGERLELHTVSGPADNRTDEDVRDEVALTPSERVVAAARLSRTLTAITSAARD
jgi:transcriptional regulator with XRE-family HTH domain